MLGRLGRDLGSGNQKQKVVNKSDDLKHPFGTQLPDESVMNAIPNEPKDAAVQEVRSLLLCRHE
jgi:hypothetical protein